MMNEPHVLPRHATQLGYCVSGQDRVAIRMGYDLNTWYTTGIPVSQIVSTSNPMVKKLIAHAIAEFEIEQGSNGNG